MKTRQHAFRRNSKRMTAVILSAAFSVSTSVASSALTRSSANSSAAQNPACGVMTLHSAVPASAVDSSPGPHVQQGESSTTIVIINGEHITAAEFRRDIRHFARSVSGGYEDAAVVEGSQLVVDVVDGILIAQRGRQLGYSLTDEQYASVLANIRARNAALSEPAFEREIEHSTVLQRDLRDRLERQMIFTRAKLAVFNGTTISDDEITSYYEAHRSAFGLASLQQAREEIRRILITPERQAEAWETYLESLRTEALIEWNSQDYARRYDEGRMERVKHSARKVP